MRQSSDIMIARFTTKKTTFLKTVFPMSAPYWGDLLYVLVDATQLLSEHRSLVPIGREVRHVHEQLAAKVLAEPLRDPKACESGETTERRASDKTESNEDDHNGRLPDVLLGESHVNQLAHQQRVNRGDSSGARCQYESKRDSP